MQRALDIATTRDVDHQIRLDGHRWKPSEWCSSLTAVLSAMTKVQPPAALDGRFAKDRFRIDLAASTVICPRHISMAIVLDSRFRR
jgi:hypothetical protein